MQIILRSKEDGLAYAVHGYGMGIGMLMLAGIPEKCFGHGFKVEKVEKGDFLIVVDGQEYWIDPTLVDYVIER